MPEHLPSFRSPSTLLATNWRSQFGSIHEFAIKPGKAFNAGYRPVLSPAK
jgi:hypothetical protein